jgi:peptidoglycan/xylan/chitin deacetylase (PgdA/CDA1 family)/folate-dependent phosphoribosylglycinamide formyltransferase PurN
MTAKLRLVVFTGGELAPVNRVLFERLAADPLLDLAAIIVDDYRRPRKSLVARVSRALREDGLGWLAFKFGSKIRSIADKATHRLTALAHGQPRGEESYDAFEKRTAIRVFRVTDIHDGASLALIRSFSPELGMIVGGRILRDCVTTIPVRGTLNIHKLKLPLYRGGGPVGYWETLAGEPSIGVSIHYATTQVDAGPVLAEATIPIEACDTLESLKLKADLRGAQLYHETLQHFAQGQRDGTAQDLSQGTTYRAPSEYKVWKLQRRLERSAARSMEAWRSPWIVRSRVLAQYLAVLPRLIAARRQLIRMQRAPISIFFYHLVADSPLNHMCLRLPAFVRQVEFLRRYYTLLSLDETVERLRSGKNDEVAASLTFDDGYESNTWAIEYLRYFGIPATFFVSIGHVGDGSSFEHDRKRGYDDARPMSEADVRRLADDGFIVGSHGVHHEDFGSLSTATAEWVLRESRQMIKDVCGYGPAHFAFPKGQRGTNITSESFALALKHYAYIFSAYGGYSFPQAGRRHFLRMANPTEIQDLQMAMSGYTGFRQCLIGNAWGVKTDKLDPCSAAPRPAPGLPAGYPLPQSGS